MAIRQLSIVPVELDLQHANGAGAQALVDCSQDTVPITVFRRRSDSLFQTGFMYSMVEALELCNSPASKRKGLPSTIICVTAPFFLRAGSGAALGAALAAGAGVCAPAHASGSAVH